MTHSQASKRARKIRKQARFAKLWGWWAHPSHKSGRRWLEIYGATELPDNRTDSVGSLGVNNCTLTCKAEVF